MQGKITRLSKIAQQDPDVDVVQAFSGGGGGTTMNTGRCFITLKPWGKPRKSTADQVIARLRPKLNSIPGITLFLQAAQDLRVGGRQSAAQYQYTLQSDKLEDLTKWAPILTNMMKRMPQFTDVVSDQQNSGLEAGLNIDRPTAARLGITASALDNVLYDGFGEREIARTFSPLNQYYVVMEVDPAFWQTPEAQSGLCAFHHRCSGTARRFHQPRDLPPPRSLLITPEFFPPSLFRSISLPESHSEMPSTPSTQKVKAPAFRLLSTPISPAPRKPFKLRLIRSPF